MIENCCGEDVPHIFFLTCEKTKATEGAWLVICKGFSKNGNLLIEDISAWTNLDSAKHQAESCVGFANVEWLLVDGNDSSPRTLTAKFEF